MPLAGSQTAAVRVRFGELSTAAETHQYSLTQIQSSFMSFTAKSIIKKLAVNDPDLLESLRVHKHDRIFQVWKREPLSIELFTQTVFIHKLNYIHNNPVMAALVSSAEAYEFSSAAYYINGDEDFNFLTHYNS